MNPSGWVELMVSGFAVGICIQTFAMVMRRK